MRAITWVIVEEVRSGDWGIGGRALTTEDVRALAAGAVMRSIVSALAAARRRHGRRCGVATAAIAPAATATAAPGRRASTSCRCLTARSASRVHVDGAGTSSRPGAPRHAGHGDHGRSRAARSAGTAIRAPCSSR